MKETRIAWRRSLPWKWQESSVTSSMSATKVRQARLRLWRASLLVLVAHHFRLTCDGWPLGVFLVVLDTSTFSHLCLWKGAELRLAAVRRVAVVCHWWMESAAAHLKQLENSNVRYYCVVLASYECSNPQPLSVFCLPGSRLFFFKSTPLEANEPNVWWKLLWFRGQNTL